LTFKNYLRLLVSFGLIACIHLWRIHGGERESGSGGRMWVGSKWSCGHPHRKLDLAECFLMRRSGSFCTRISSL